MPRILAFAILPTLAVLPSLAAQVPVLKTHSDIGLSRSGKIGPNFQPSGQTIAQATTVWLPPVNSYSIYLLAETRVSPFPGPRTSTYIFRETAIIDISQNPTKYTSSTATRTADKPHEWLLKIPADAKGNELRLGAQNHTRARTPPSYGIIGLDIGNNGKFEFIHLMSQGAISRSFKLGTAAVDVRIVTYAKIDWTTRGYYNFSLGITINPRTAFKFSSFSRGCGMQMNASDVLTGFGHTVSLNVSGAFPSTFVLVELGIQQVRFPLPGTTCTFDLIPLLHVPLLANPSGKVKWSSRVPDGFRGVFYMQAISTYTKLGYTSFRTSDGLRVDAGN